VIFRDRCLACPCGIGKRGTHIAHKSHVAEQPTRGVWLLRSVEPRVAKRKKRFACRSIPIRRVRSRPRRSLLIHALRDVRHARDCVYSDRVRSCSFVNFDFILESVVRAPHTEISRCTVHEREPTTRGLWLLRSVVSRVAC